MAGAFKGHGDDGTSLQDAPHQQATHFTIFQKVNLAILPLAVSAGPGAFLPAIVRVSSTLSPLLLHKHERHILFVPLSLLGLLSPHRTEESPSYTVCVCALQQRQANERTQPTAAAAASSSSPST